MGYPGDAEATRYKERITVRNVVVHNLQNGAKSDVIVFMTFVVHIKCREHVNNDCHIKRYAVTHIVHCKYLSINNVFESGLAHLGVDLVVSGMRELGTKGVVEGQCVAEVPQASAIRLAMPLTYLKI